MGQAAGVVAVVIDRVPTAQDNVSRQFDGVTTVQGDVQISAFIPAGGWSQLQKVESSGLPQHSVIYLLSDHGREWKLLTGCSSAAV